MDKAAVIAFCTRPCQGVCGHNQQNKDAKDNNLLYRNNIFMDAIMPMPGNAKPLE